MPRDPGQRASSTDALRALIQILVLLVVLVLGVAGLYRLTLWAFGL